MCGHKDPLCSRIYKDTYFEEAEGIYTCPQSTEEKTTTVPREITYPCHKILLHVPKQLGS